MNMSFAKVSIPQNAVQTRLHKAADVYKKYMDKLEQAPAEKLTFLQKRELLNYKTARAMLDGTPNSPVFRTIG